MVQETLCGFDNPGWVAARIDKIVVQPVIQASTARSEKQYLRGWPVSTRKLCYLRCMFRVAEHIEDDQVVMIFANQVEDLEMAVDCMDSRPQGGEQKAP
jgi:hypothetical protein